MKVLTMQLNSITIMDLVAYGGAALGMVLAVLEFRAGRIPFWGCFAVIFLSADFFLPMRQLGSFFHIAMNGMAASDKIFTLLDLPEDALAAVRRGRHAGLQGPAFLLRGRARSAARRFHGLSPRRVHGHRG